MSVAARRSGRDAERAAPLRIGRQRAPGVGQLGDREREDTRCVVHDRVAHARRVECDRGRVPRRRFDDDDAPSFVVGGVHEQPRSRQEIVLGFLVDEAGELHVVGCFADQPGPLRAVADDHEPAARGRPHLPPRLQDQLDPFVRNQAAQDDEQRLDALGRALVRDLGAGVGDDDPVAVYAELSERLGRRGGHRVEDAPPVDPPEPEPFEPPTHGGNGPGKVLTPLLAVHVMDETHDRAPRPKRHEERDPVLDIDDNVGIGHDMAGNPRRVQVLRVPTAAVEHRVRARRDRATAHECHRVAAIHEAAGDAVDQDFAAAGLRVGEVAATRGSPRGSHPGPELPSRPAGGGPTGSVRRARIRERRG